MYERKLIKLFRLIDYIMCMVFVFAKQSSFGHSERKQGAFYFPICDSLCVVDYFSMKERSGTDGTLIINSGLG